MIDDNKTEFGSEYILIFIGYSDDALIEAELLAGLEQLLQKEIDKIRRINLAIPFTRIKIWKWNSDAQLIKGGQRIIVNPILNRADIAIFVFKEKVGNVTWQELNYVISKSPSIPVLSFFKAIPPDHERMRDETVTEQWLDLLKKSKSLNAGWTDKDTNAIAPLPKYQNLEDLKNLATDKLTTEIVRMASKYALSVKMVNDQITDNRKISSMGHLIHKIKAKDATGRWAYYFVLVMPERERVFLDVIKDGRNIDLEDYGKVIASCYGETPSQEIKNYLKHTYGFDV
jgi:hypothetical protein